MARDKTVEDYVAGLSQWQPEVKALVELCRKSGLDESIKWGAPCYSRNGSNVVGIGAFKSYFGLWFFQGALLDDKEDVLINAQSGKTKALRQWRMHSSKDIRKTVIRRYLGAAARLADKGETVAVSRPSTVSVPEELRAALAKNARDKAAFDKLRPGQQREYAKYIADAKRSDTKHRRLEKILPMIRAGAGLNDRYR